MEEALRDPFVLPHDRTARLPTRRSSRARLMGQAMARKSARIHARVVRKGVAFVAIAIALSLTFVWTRVRVVQLGYEVSQLNQQVGNLLKQKDQLEAEVARLKSLDRLERLAKEHFYMRLPTGNEIIFIASQAKKQ